MLWKYTFITKLDSRLVFSMNHDKELFDWMSRDLTSDPIWFIEKFNEPNEIEVFQMILVRLQAKKIYECINGHERWKKKLCRWARLLPER